MEKNYFEQMQEINKNAENAIIDLLINNDYYEMYFSKDLKFNVCYQKGLDLGIDLLKGIVLEFDDNDNIFSLYLITENEKLSCDIIIVNVLAELYPIVKEELNRREREYNNQLAKINSKSDYVYGVFCLNKHIPYADETDFISKTFKYGNVYSFEEFNNKIFNCKDFNIKILEYTKEYIESCPHCGCEVVLETKFKWQTCPICNKDIKPCNLCETCDANCPLGTIKKP